MARCLVTGHEGYIGSRLYKKLQELGHFYFGSQVIIGSDMMLRPAVVPDNKTRVFPGDPLFE